MYAARNTKNTRWSWNDPREQRLRSRHSILIVTDVEHYAASYYPTSKPQRLYRAGVIDFNTGRLGYYYWGQDCARAMLRVGTPPPPWPEPLPFALTSVRQPHKNDERGRFIVRMVRTDIPVESELRSVALLARRFFEQDGFRSNSAMGMWNDLVVEIEAVKVARELALAMPDAFAPRDLARAVHDQIGWDINVSAILRQLVEEKQLTRLGAGRGTRYAPRLGVGCAGRLVPVESSDSAA